MYIYMQSGRILQKRNQFCLSCWYNWKHGDTARLNKPHKRALSENAAFLPPASLSEVRDE
ncbi:hypothetical protein KCP73_03830 [Salmonella enterica subsp. enterica]|nr:hypothetical protein KCP73_03830 [Salmonella enterica subsp. enterica]